jgi:hypothetical protein
LVKAEDLQLRGCGFEHCQYLLEGVMKASCYIGKEIAVAKRGPFFKIKKKI